MLNAIKDILLPWLKLNGINEQPSEGGDWNPAGGVAPAQITWRREGKSPWGENPNTLAGYIADRKTALMEGLLRDLVEYYGEGSYPPRVPFLQFLNELNAASTPAPTPAPVVPAVAIGAQLTLKESQDFDLDQTKAYFHLGNLPQYPGEGVTYTLDGKNYLVVKPTPFVRVLQLVV